MRLFTIDDDHERAINDWKENLPELPPAAIGGACTYEFTPTGVGTYITVTRADGHFIEVDGDDGSVRTGKTTSTEEQPLSTRDFTPLDLGLLTADQVARMLGSTRSTILQIKGRIGFTKPVKEVFFRFDDVVAYVMTRTYRHPLGERSPAHEEAMEASERIARELLRRLKDANSQ